MNRKKCSYLWMLVWAFLMIPVLTVSAYADSIKIIDESDDESVDTEDDYAEDTTYSLARGSDLNYGTTTISKSSSMKVAIGGITQCHQKCDTVYLTLALERKVNGSYATYKSWDFSTTNATHLSKSLTVIVPSGYYYRVRGYHATSNDGRSESTTTLTNGIKIS